MSTGALIGTIVGSVSGFIILVGGLMYWRKRRNSDKVEKLTGMTS
jgi:LPXTG-motif cell wall-anchored protein